jgi:two-component system sensor histidine kinase PrrB
MTLRVRVALAGLVAVGIVLLAVGWWLSSSLERDGRREVDRELAQRVRQVSPPEGAVAKAPPKAPAGVADALRAKLKVAAGAPPGARQAKDAALLEGTGVFTIVRPPFGGGKIAGDVPADALSLPAVPGYATHRLGGRTWRVVVARASDGTVAMLGSSLEPVLARVRTTRELLLRLGLAALAAAGLAGLAIGSVALAPLQRLRREAEAIGVPGAGARLPSGGPPEVAALASALDRMLARLRDSAGQTEQALDATRRFAGDAGHELRTPLAGMAADIAVLQDRSAALPEDARDAVAALAGQHERLTALLDALQTLALGDARTALAFATVDLADVAEEAVATARRRHPQREIALDVGAVHAPVHGWPEGLRAVADNLVENALRHGGAGARVQLGVRTADGRVALVVDDDGPGVPVAERERIFERFGRGHDASPGGSGLGLSIVAQQAALHDGRVEVAASARGGARFVVTLPLATPPPAPA